MTIISTGQASTFAALVFSVTFATSLMAQEAQVPGHLPGGASSLTETHGDWTVRCEVTSQNETSQRVCAMSQRQANNQEQQVLAVELLPSPEGLEGSLVLPFGLAVTQPATLAIDEGEPIEAFFSTCVPAGCVVPIETGSNTLTAMRAGSVMTVSASTVDGQTFQLPVSLTGFTAATSRITELTQ